MSELKWTTAPPTVEGWYWVRFSNEQIECVTIGIIDGKPIEKFYDHWALEGVTHWLGPLPEPEPPKE